MIVDFDGEVSLTEKRLLPTECGIYFVCDETGEILYVGKSVNIRQRWGSHHRLHKARGIESVIIKWKYVDKGNLDKTERFYIETLLPSWNNRIDIADSKEVPIRIDREQYNQLAEIRESDGIPIAEQVRRAIREWLDKRQGQVKDND